MDGPWEDFAQPEAGPWDDFKDAPADVPRMAQDSGEALLTNLPTQGFKQDLVRGAPAALTGMGGAAAGAAMGLPFGPVGVGVGAVLGGFGGGLVGEGARQATAGLTAINFPEQNYPVPTPGQATLSMLTQGALQAGGEVIGLGARGLMTGAKSLAPAFMKVAANVPERSGAAAMSDLGRLSRAPTEDAVSGAYDAFHSASGTVSRRDAIRASGDPFDTVSRAMNTMKDAFNKLRSGALSAQEAVEASQAGRIIRDMKFRGVEMAQQVGAQADELKGMFDDFIEKGMGPQSRTGLAGETIESAGSPGFPEWQRARGMAFERSVADDFSWVFPRNVNRQPNLLASRGAIAGGAATGAGIGAMLGGPVGAGAGALIGGGVGLAGVSPLAYGTAIKAAGYVGKAAPVFRVLPNAAAGGAGSALEQAYRQRAITP